MSVRRSGRSDWTVCGSAPVDDEGVGHDQLALQLGQHGQHPEYPSQAEVWTAVTMGVVVTLAAIFGAVYKVPAPTIWCAYAVAIVFVVGLVLAFVDPGRQTAHTSYDEFAKAEHGPVNM